MTKCKMHRLAEWTPFHNGETYRQCLDCHIVQSQITLPSRTLVLDVGYAEPPSAHPDGLDPGVDGRSAEGDEGSL